MAELSRARIARIGALLGKKIWLSMHPRDVGSHLTIRPPSAPQGHQCESATRFSLRGVVPYIACIGM